MSSRSSLIHDEPASRESANRRFAWVQRPIMSSLQEPEAHPSIASVPHLKHKSGHPATRAKVSGKA